MGPGEQPENRRGSRHFSLTTVKFLTVKPARRRRRQGAFFVVVKMPESRYLSHF